MGGGALGEPRLCNSLLGSAAAPAMAGDAGARAERARASLRADGGGGGGGVIGARRPVSAAASAAGATAAAQQHAKYVHALRLSAEAGDGGAGGRELAALRARPLGSASGGGRRPVGGVGVGASSPDRRPGTAPVSSAAFRSPPPPGAAARNASGAPLGGDGARARPETAQPRTGRPAAAYGVCAALADPADATGAREQPELQLERAWATDGSASQASALGPSPGAFAAANADKPGLDGCARAAQPCSARSSVRSSEGDAVGSDAVVRRPLIAVPTVHVLSTHAPPHGDKHGELSVHWALRQAPFN